MAALRGAQTLTYLNNMSRVLRSGRLAVDSLATLVQRGPGALEPMNGHRSHVVVEHSQCSIWNESI